MKAALSDAPLLVEFVVDGKTIDEGEAKHEHDDPMATRAKAIKAKYEDISSELSIKIVDWLMDNPGAHSPADMRKALSIEKGKAFNDALAEIRRANAATVNGSGPTRRYYHKLD